MSAAKILVVDDDPTILSVVSRYLQKEGYNVSEADCAEAMYSQISKTQPDLIVLDWMLPDGDGLTLAGEQRRLNQEVGIIMLTGKSDPIDKVVGLEMGADDYLVKPVDLRELLARVRSLLRRRLRLPSVSPVNPALEESSSPKEAYFNNWRIDLLKRTIYQSDGQQLLLTGQEFRLLEELVISAPKEVSRDRLLEVLMGKRYDLQTRSIDVIIGKLRKKLGQGSDGHRLILTIRGIGYQFATEVTLKN